MEEKKPEEKQVEAEKAEQKVEENLQEEAKPKKKPKEKKETPEKLKIHQLEEQIKDLTDLLQRTQANFENYRKQQEKRIEEFQNQANQTLILQLLPVLDNFELALKNTLNPPDFLKGIELIYSQLFTLLEAQGLKPLPTKNQLFDPYFHEALLKVPSDQPENTILEEFQKGFLLHNQILRPAKVKVSSGLKEKNPSPDNKQSLNSNKNNLNSNKNYQNLNHQGGNQNVK